MSEPTEAAESIYLDNAATSYPKPAAVYDAVDRYMRHNGASVGRGSHASAVAGKQLVEQCRQRVARILNAESADRIAFTFNCTDSLNLLLRGILRSGDRVVTTKLEHNSVLRPLADLTEQIGITVEHVDFDSSTGFVDLQTMESAIEREPTKLVVLNHASNVTGVVQHAESVGRLAKSHGAHFLVDAAQTLGHVPVDVQRLNVDFLAAAGHKGLLGPLGTGVIYVRSGLEGQLQSIRSGGTGTESESMRQPTSMPTMLESGNMNALGIAGLNAAAEWLLDSGIDKLHQNSDRLFNALKTGLTNITGVDVFAGTDDATNVGIVSFTVEGVDSREVATILEQSFAIQCRAGLHCAPLAHQQLGTTALGGTVRLSVGPFTTDKQVLTAVDAVTAISAAMT